MKLNKKYDALYNGYATILPNENGNISILVQTDIAIDRIRSFVEGTSLDKINVSFELDSAKIITQSPLQLDAIGNEYALDVPIELKKGIIININIVNNDAINTAYIGFILEGYNKTNETNIKSVSNMIMQFNSNLNVPTNTIKETDIYFIEKAFLLHKMYSNIRDKDVLITLCSPQNKILLQNPISTIFLDKQLFPSSNMYFDNKFYYAPLIIEKGQHLFVKVENRKVTSVDINLMCLGVECE